MSDALFLATHPPRRNDNTTGRLLLTHRCTPA
jgi:hypothetical protein